MNWGELIVNLLIASGITAVILAVREIKRREKAIKNRYGATGE